MMISKTEKGPKAAGLSDGNAVHSNWEARDVRSRILVRLSVVNTLALLAVLGLFLWRFAIPQDAVSRSRSAPVGEAGQRVGAWGELEQQWIQLETPPAYLPDVEYENAPTRWYLPEPSFAAARARLIQAGMPEKWAQVLDSAPDVWKSGDGGGYVYPTAEVIDGLDRAARLKVYQLLARFPNNQPYLEPKHFIGGELAEWFDGCDLPRSVIDQVDQLSMRMGNVTFFCDKNLVLAKINDPNVRRDFVRCLERRSAIFAKLVIGQDSDLDAILDYWFPGGRPQGIETLLRAAAGASQEHSVDLIHLLTPFAKQHLYTYPLADRPLASLQNCTWTVANYFMDPPSDEFYWPAKVSQFLSTNYYPIASQPEYGDIIAFEGTTGEIIHASIYLADGLAFTKNGHAIRAPWLIMPLEDLKTVYSFSNDFKVQIYRRNPYPAVSPAPTKSDGAAGQLNR